MPSTSCWRVGGWKTAFRTHQLTLEREQRATGERGDVFGSASAATALHGITDATARPSVHTSPDALAFHAVSGPSSPHANDLALQALDGHLDRMSDTATNSGVGHPVEVDVKGLQR